MNYGRTLGTLLVLAAPIGCGTIITEAPRDADVLDAPLPGLTGEQVALFLRGDEEFGKRFTPSMGLGPLFNDVSCAACHSGDGRGRLENSVARIGTPTDDFLRPLGGPQIQNRAIPGAVAEQVPPGVAVSRRLPPPVFGVGLIEAIPEATLLQLADSADRNGDGVSGRPNWIMPPGYAEVSGLRIGRFGRKAQVATLLEQTVEAYHQDMGITSDFQPTDNLPSDASGADRVVDPEVPRATVAAVVAYIRMLAPPAPGAETPEVARGRAVFASAGCAACHVPSLRTGTTSPAFLRGRDVELYSDLLLHDMGDALADDRPDGSASGREWKTTPLWGLRLMRTFLNGDAFLMHDGRARTIAEAIELHGGESGRARAAYAALPAADREALLRFVGSR